MAKDKIIFGISDYDDTNEGYWITFEIRENGNEESEHINEDEFLAFLQYKGVDIDRYFEINRECGCFEVFQATYFEGTRSSNRAIEAYKQWLGSQFEVEAE